MAANKKAFIDPDDPKIIRLRNFCSVPEGFGNPFSSPGSRYPVFAEEAETPKIGWGDIRQEETPERKAA